MCRVPSLSAHGAPLRHGKQFAGPRPDFEDTVGSTKHGTPGARQVAKSALGVQPQQVDYREFRRLREGCISNLPPADDSLLDSAASRLRDRLSSSAMFAQVTVETSEDPERLLVAEVRFRPGASPAKVSSYLEAIWVSELRLPGLGEFNFLTKDGHVELESFTGDRAAGHFLTLHLLAVEGQPHDFEKRDRTRPVPAEDPVPTKRWFRR
jgi:hypothetical protein